MLVILVVILMVIIVVILVVILVVFMQEMMMKSATSLEPVPSHQEWIKRASKTAEAKKRSDLRSPN